VKRRRFHNPPRGPHFGKSGGVGTPVPPAKPTGRNVIRLNTEAIRKKALREHQRAVEALGNLNRLRERYRQHDVPGFRAWVHGTFGSLLTRQREVQEEIRKKQALLDEITLLSERYGLSEIAAYRKWVWRRDHPDEAAEEDRRFEEARRQSEEARQEREEAWRKKHGGNSRAAADDPFGDDEPWEDELGDAAAEEFADMPDREWEAFGAFAEEMFGIRLPRRGSGHKDDDTAGGKSAKNLYRAIVRQLHPDHHGNMSEARKELWHEAQEAYRCRDVDALRAILASCEGSENGPGLHTPVAAIRWLIQRVKTDTRALRRDLGKLRNDRAWEYETRIKDPRFVVGIGWELKDLLRSQEAQLGMLTGYLGNLERRAFRRPAAKAHRPAAKPNRPAPANDDPLDLPF